MFPSGNGEGAPDPPLSAQGPSPAALPGSAPLLHPGMLREDPELQTHPEPPAGLGEQPERSGDLDSEVFLNLCSSGGAG